VPTVELFITRMVKLPRTIPAGSYSLVVAATDMATGAETDVRLPFVVKPVPIAVLVRALGWDLVSFTFLVGSMMGMGVRVRFQIARKTSWRSLGVLSFAPSY
jgi:hypothetical protein